MRRRGVLLGTGWCGAFVVACALGAASADALSLDEQSEIQLGLRAYTGVRIGTEDTDVKIISESQPVDGQPLPRVLQRSLTFPYSTSFSLRQHRVFAEVDFKHDLTRLLREGFGPLGLLNYLPFKIRKLEYFLAYRGEYEGIYDYGPSEFRTNEQFRDPLYVTNSPFAGAGGLTREDILPGLRQRLRKIGSLRNRLFQAYLQMQVDKVTLRFGRQILAWGETDVFRLLDNINPLDSSFGGLLVPLDERRVPLDMLRATWYLGDFRHTGIPGLSLLSKLPWYEAYLEGFVAIDDKVGFSPGIVTGSAWGLPNVNVPSTGTYTQRYQPGRNFRDARGGLNFRFSVPFPGINELTMGVAHYFTYFDTPVVEIVTQSFPFPITEDVPARGYSAWAKQTAPRVGVSGVFGNFAIPPEWVRPLRITGEPIVRFEVAHFHNEARQTQKNLDPFYYALPRPGDPPGSCSRNGRRVNARSERTEDGLFCSGGKRTGDSWNVVVGLDLQQWLRFLNPNATFFISTQFFYKHLNAAVKREPLDTPFPGFPGQPPIYQGEVLPVPEQFRGSDTYGLPVDAAVPDFVHHPADQFLQTLLIATPYYSGRILPNLQILYDWSGSLAMIPGVTYSRDPFRVTVGYNFLWANRLKGGSGISLLRDRDNFLIQLEYVI